MWKLWVSCGSCSGHSNPRIQAEGEIYVWGRQFSWAKSCHCIENACFNKAYVIFTNIPQAEQITLQNMAINLSGLLRTNRASRMRDSEFKTSKVPNNLPYMTKVNGTGKFSPPKDARWWFQKKIQSAIDLNKSLQKKNDENQRNLS